ncbi:GNAT family N-acetyltransferase [Candidatus Parcubacteria bacterium]|nr:GNAT family N-acetyltransferase [Candidatus Parcubacteria bacterium]
MESQPVGHQRMILRSYCPDTLNFFLNHSQIQPMITQDGGPEYLDAKDLLKKSGTHFFIGDGVCLLLWKIGVSLYQGDIYAPARKRGLTARQAALEAIAFMFNQTDAGLIEVRVPRFNKPSRYLAAGLGFQRKGIVPSAWKKDGALHDVIVYGLEKSSWAGSPTQ